MTCVLHPGHASALAGTGPAMQWHRVTDLPDPMGLKGMYGGISGDHILLAGGSNFPVPQRDGGVKTYHRTIYSQPVAQAGGGVWTIEASLLPRPLGEGAAVSTPHGVVCLGGRNDSGVVADVWLMRRNPATGRLEFRVLPALSKPAANAAAVWSKERIFVAGGEDETGGMHALLELDLAAALGDPTGSAGWVERSTWPGPRRFGAALAGIRLEGRDFLLLAGGKIGTPGPSRREDYLADAYLYDIEAAKWRLAASMPRPALLAPVITVDATHVAVCGGSDGHNLHLMAALGDRYRIPDDVLVFDGGTDAWTRLDRMPEGVVGAAVIAVAGGWLLAGGEYSPGLRTPHVYRIEFEVSP